MKVKKENKKVRLKSTFKKLRSGAITPGKEMVVKQWKE